jgi:hypothetical protein
MEPVSRENFEEWTFHPVTKHLMKMLQNDREAMKEGLINNAFDDEKGGVVGGGKGFHLE